MDLRKKLQVKPGEKPDLSQRPADATPGCKNRDAAEREFAEDVQRLDTLQYTLYAEGKQSLLVVLQAMDAGGKDGTIRKVFGPLNPQGVRVTSFKAPTEEELSHDFLWRIHRAVPPRGMIGVFNRSHYEDVLIVRVHGLVPKKVWSSRYRRINDFEQALTEANVGIVKFYLHVSKDEQLERLKARLDEPGKHWKVNPADFEERKRWDDYMAAFEDALGRCSTKDAPWYVIPADRKWYRNFAVARILRETLEEMAPKLPAPTCDISSIEVK